MAACSSCNGTGTCKTCNGTGQETVVAPAGVNPPPKTTMKPCMSCNGTGKCQACDGTGDIEE